jgi:general secretion pathway protein F
VPRFEYGGFDASGAKVTGTIEATGRRAALETLRNQQIFATGVQELSTQSRRTSFRWQRRRIPLLELAAATRQLATLLSAGLPLDEVLSSVAEQIERPALALALNQAREEVVQGQSLYLALEAQSQIFSPLYVNMVKVGESSGTLDQVLAQLADLQENQARIRSRIRAALTYPALMGLVGCAVLLLLFVFVVPQITRMLDNLGMELPLMTRLLIGTGNLLSSSWWVFVLLAVLATVALQRYARSEKGSLALHRRALKLPLIGRLNLFTATARAHRPRYRPGPDQQQNPAPGAGRYRSQYS